MNERQSLQIPGARGTRASRTHDYVGVFPENVFPTTKFDVLERGGNLLFIKTYEFGQRIADAHRKIFRLMTRFGEVVDAPGTITVICVWGLGATPREVVVFDYNGEHAPKRYDVEGWRRLLRQWWDQAKR